MCLPWQRPPGLLSNTSACQTTTQILLRAGGRGPYDWWKAQRTKVRESKSWERLYCNNTTSLWGIITFSTGSDVCFGWPAFKETRWSCASHTTQIQRILGNGDYEWVQRREKEAWKLWLLRCACARMHVRWFSCVGVGVHGGRRYRHLNCVGLDGRTNDNPSTKHTQLSYANALIANARRPCLIT